MKKESMFLIGLIVIGLIAFTACPSPQKVLFFQQDGNYVVDNNYILQAATKMSDADIEELVRLDDEYFDKTKGKLILVNSGAIRNLSQRGQTGQVNEGGRGVDILQKSMMKYDVMGWLRANYINIGCKDRADDWTIYGDLKNRLDVIFKKYNAVLVDNHYAIEVNRVATAAVPLSEVDMSSMNALSIRGADEYTICPDLKGVLKFTRVLTTHHNTPFDFDARVKVNDIMTKYNVNVR